ncbi:MAG: hypothetical protein EPO22_00500, partial [Dehalococcoidia bacterium]
MALRLHQNVESPRAVAPATIAASRLTIAVIQRFLPSTTQGGVGHFTDQLCAELVRRGHDVTVFSADLAPDGAPYGVVRPDPDERATRGRLGAIFGFGVWLARQDFSRFDVIHAMGDN